MNVVLEKKKQDRFKFLRKLYELSDGHPLAILQEQHVGSQIGISAEDADKIMRYLDGEGLAKFRNMGGGISITHQGVKEIEAALSEPTSPTEHFPAINVINVGTMTNSQIQQGSSNSNQNQNVTSTDFVKPLQEMISEIQKANPSDDQLETAEICKDVILHQAGLPLEHRDSRIVQRFIDKLSKLNTLITFSKSGYAAFEKLQLLASLYFNF